MRDKNKAPNIQLFKFSHENQKFTIRSVYFEGEHWYVANDVCSVLKLTNPTETLKRVHEDDLSKTEVIDSIGRKQRTNIVTESGLYALIFQSNKPIAKKFKRWVTKEVLPQIRKTGSYGSSNHLFVKRFNLNWRNVDTGYFSVISELYLRLYGKFEMLGYLIPDKAFDGKEMRPDTSVGKLFPKYLEEYYPSLNLDFERYDHHFPLSKLIVKARQYPNMYLPLFIGYLENHWIPMRAYNYFEERDPKALEYLPLLLSRKAS